MADVFAEVHAEVGEVFDDEDVVFVGEVGEALDFVVGEAHPGGVVWVGEEHG